MDTTIVYAEQQHSVAASLKKSDRDKMEKYNDHAKATKTNFTPLCFETYGAMTTSTSHLITELVKLAWQRANKAIPLHKLIQYWRVKFSVILAKANGKLLHDRLEDRLQHIYGVPSEDDIAFEFKYNSNTEFNPFDFSELIEY